MAKKNYRKKHRKISKSKSLMTFPLRRSVNMIIPDTLDVNLPITTEFKTTGAWGTGGAMAYFNVGGNYIYHPFITSGAGPTFVRLDAAIGGANGGFAGAVNTGYPTFTAQTPNFFLTLFGLYRNSFVSGSSITVNTTLSSANDECDCVIVPQASVNDPAMYALQESRYAKKGGVLYYIDNLKDNSVSNSMTTKKMYGIQQPSKYLIDSVTNIGAEATNPSTYTWIWQVGLANRLNQAATGTSSIKVTVNYKVRFFNAKGIYL